MNAPVNLATTPDYPDGPTVSVVIPCYNGAKYLRATLAAVLGQSHAPFEVLVVDDGSSDDSAAIAESFGPPVRVIRQPNQGESAARNRGIQEARGEWVAFCDADDLWQPRKLAAQLALVRPEDVGVCTHYVIRDAAGAEADHHVSVDPADFSLDWGCRHGLRVFVSSLMVRASARARFPTWTRYGEDNLYHLELLREGVIGVVPEPLTVYLRHPRSQSANPLIALWLHEGVDRWICESVADLNERTRLRLLALERVVDFANRCYYLRWWDHYAAALRHLRGYSVVGSRHGRVLRRRWPTVAYSLWDRLRTATGRVPVRHAMPKWPSTPSEARVAHA